MATWQMDEEFLLVAASKYVRGMTSKDERTRQTRSAKNSPNHYEKLSISLCNIYTISIIYKNRFYKNSYYGIGAHPGRWTAITGGGGSDHFIRRWSFCWLFDRHRGWHSLLSAITSVGLKLIGIYSSLKDGSKNLKTWRENTRESTE